MRRYRLSVVQIFLIAFLTVCVGTPVALCFRHTPPAEAPEAGVVRSWNAAVETIEPEDLNFRALLDSYKRNPPGRVLFTPDVRAEQKRRRVQLIEAIIASHQERVRRLQDLKTFENACP